MEFNINDHVRVRLTDRGRTALKKDHYDFWSKVKDASDGSFEIPEYKPPVEDRDGWSRWQMHRLMNKFGKHVPRIGLDVPFEPIIEIEVPES